MKSVRNLYVIVIVLVACSLVIGALAGVQFFGLEEGLYLHKWSLFRVVLYVSGVTGVIWLGWCWLKQRSKIINVVERLKQRTEVPALASGCEEKFETSRKRKFFALIKKPIADELSKAINKYLESDSEYISQLRKQIKDLNIRIQLSQRQKKNTEAIIYSIRDAVIVVDEFDKLLMANKAAGELFHFDYKSSQHKLLGELINTDKSEFVGFLRRSRQSKVQYKKKEIEFLADGRTKFFDCIVSCVHDEADNVCGVAAVLHDITRERQISQMKNDFVSNVSHELKTPLASISAYSEMLADGEAKDEETKKEFYSVIQAQADRLNRLIEDVLNISRIESGMVKVEKQPVSLTILIEEQLEMIRSYAEEKNVTVTARKPIIFDRVDVDRDMISQVIINLLSNAVKYTPSGGSVKIGTEVDENEGFVRVTVTDTGVGILPEEAEHVFDKFYRAGSSKKKAKGTGLGLNLVKQTIEKVHDGRVFVKSEPGVGSTFGFELPLITAGTLESV